MPPINNPESKLERVAFGKRETAKHLLTVDDLICYATTPEGGLVLEFVRWNKDRKPTESYRVILCQEDTQRLKSILPR